MKRRVGIAQALLGDPRLIIVDEPTAGLDPEERIRIRNLLSEISAHAAVLLSNSYRRRYRVNMPGDGSIV